MSSRHQGFVSSLVPSLASVPTSLGRRTRHRRHAGFGGSSNDVLPHRDLTALASQRDFDVRAAC